MATLFHYCSTETFVSIVSSRTIRLSSLTQSNYSQEGALILDLLIQFAKNSGLSGHLLLNLESELRWAYELFDGLGFCLSEKGDLLSQWRGYADDGRGICIGFSSGALEQMGAQLREKGERNFALKKIVYDLEGQKSIAEEHFKKLKSLIDEGAFASTLGTLLAPCSPEKIAAIEKSTKNARLALMIAMLKMFDIKNPAFIEEQEWRLVSFLPKAKDDDSILKFRACNDKIIPYFEVSLPELELPVIEKIILGPKHQSPSHVAEQLLIANGFGKVEITKSSATYR